MNIHDLHRTSHFARILARREHELCAVLHSAETLDAVGAGDHGMVDFKDMAAEQTAATIDDAKAEHSAHELEQVLAARHRLHRGTYGICVDCGEEIPSGRLESLPATPYCTACQTVHEYPLSAAHH
ncbi:MAG: TraR/DksA C4-type zinc finger protein [Ramlibacter sp.]